MNFRAPAAIVLAVLSVPAASVPARAESPTGAPLRVAFALQAQADNDPLERRLLQSVEKGLEKSYGRPVQVVDASGSDAVVSVWYRQVGRGRPAATWDSVHAKVDGRELTVSLPVVYNPFQQRARWTYAGTQLGRDIGLVLKLRTESRPALTLEGLLGQLAGHDPAKRAQAANEVGRLGTPARAAIPALLAMLDDERRLHTVGSGLSSTPARQAAKALLELGAHAELITFFKSKADDGARAHALVAIAAGRSPESPDLIFQALDDRSRTVRTGAAGLAGAYVGRRAVPRLIEIVDQVLYIEMREAARASLVLMAGKDFKLNADAWRQWWSEQDRRR